MMPRRGESRRDEVHWGGALRRACALLLATVLAVGPAAAGERDTLGQFATIDALLAGLYDGVADIGALKHYGDLGIGTFAGLDGEMVVLDGQVYRVGADGRAAVVADAETTPFAAVVFFKPDRDIAVPPGSDFTAFQALADAALPSANLFYAFRAEGRFKSMRTRSVPRQRKPYRPLADVVKDQSVFEFKDVDGVLVGFKSPSFAKGINVPGYHLHFLTADRKAGGHVLDFTVERLEVKVDALNRFLLMLPTDAGFAAADLRPNRQEELEKVEGRRY